MLDFEAYHPLVQVLVNKYERVADQILLDAKPPAEAKVPGGLGKSFDWDILSDFYIKLDYKKSGIVAFLNIRLSTYF